uniref:SpaA isopeptide-forming pilin-related protein n=1 Tax=Listeria rocourtiae TaxID=647910 RepID=UPI003D2F83E6
MKRNFKKGFLFFIFCLVFIQVMVMAAGPSPDAKSWGNQFVTDVKILDSDGNEISEVPINAGFKVRYEWSIPNDVDVFEGDTMQVTLPSELQTAPNLESNFRVGEGGPIVATGQATEAGSQQYTITFTDYPESHSNVKGYFEFYVNFSDDVQPGDPVDIVFDVPGGSVVIPITPEEPGDPGEPGEPGDPGNPAGDKFYKSGYYTYRGTIEWYVTIIPPNLKSDPEMPGYYDPLFNVIVNDSYSEGQELVADTMKVRNVYLLDGSPHAIPAGGFSPIGVTNLDLPNRTFSINLGDLDDGYGRQISYETRITDSEIEAYTNEATVTAQDFEKGGGAAVRVEGGEGGASGDQAGFSVMKVDSNNNPLPGAKFALSRIMSDGTLDEIATDLESGDDGKVTYPQTLKFGTYQLVETEAPDGFQLLSDPHEFILDRAEIKELTVAIINEPEVGSVELLKHEAGNTGAVLEGAKFRLYEGVAPSGTPLDEYETDRTGKIMETNLAFGPYYFVE